MPRQREAEKRSFEDFLSKASPGLERMLREGLPLISRLDDVQLNALVDLGLVSIEEPHAAEQKGVPESLGLSEAEALSVGTVGSLLGISATAKESPAEAVEILRNRFSLSEKDVSGAFRLIEEFRKRAAEVSGAMTKRRLSSEVLPSFEHLWSTVDVRLKFTDGDVSTFAPVAVAYIRTDAEPPHDRFWFQMSKAEIKRLIRETQEVLDDMEQAERWVEGRLKK